MSEVTRLLDFDSSFIRGTNSSIDPSQLPVGYVWHAINTVNIAGVISCRPGHRCLVKLPKGNLQGSAIFRPQVGLEQLLVAIEGIVYIAPYPFVEFTQLDGVEFSNYAKQVFFTQTVQSANRLTPGDLSSAIEVLSPRNIMIMQDGGITAPAWFDGAKADHIKGIPFQTPIGGAMEWVGDRLWVSNGNQVFASDILNPFSFVEQVYLGSTVGFNFAGDVTALSKTPSIEFPQLLIFTAEDTSLIQADVRDRSQWPTLNGFQKEILQVGCTSDRAVTSHFGRLVWFSASGVSVYDPATARGWTSRTPIRDNEMLISKKAISEDLSLVTMAAFGQWLLVSVPSEDSYNKHTWVFNNASWETVSDEGGPTWSGLWTGTRPVEWIYGVIAGAERIYHVSTDEDGENRLWQSFTPDRLDNGCPITWAVFTRGYFGLTSKAGKPPGFTCSFAFADVALTGIDENLDIGIFVAPGVRGSFLPILAKRINAEKGSIRDDVEITATSQLFAYKGQSRIIRTQEETQISPDVESGSCPVESDDLDGQDESFQLLIVGHGPASLRWIRSFAIQSPSEDFNGSDSACINETPFNIVRFDGEASFNTDLAVSIEDISLRAVTEYTSNQTVAMTDSGISAVGVGHAESIVSQQAADRVANRIAVRQAEVEIARDLPKFLSRGEGFDE